jgi:ribosomal protein S18 acetylase RimI-like enzyme
MNEIRKIEPPLNLDQLQLLVNLEEEAFGEGGLSFFEIPAFALFGRIYFFLHRKEIVGHAIITRYFDRDAAFLYSFAIRSEFCNKGLGKKFLKLLLDELKGHFNSVYLTVAPYNEPALKIYRNAGFHVVELMKDFYGRGEDRYLMMQVFGQGSEL